jgi:hypothetical protein
MVLKKSQTIKSGEALGQMALKHPQLQRKPSIRTRGR